MYFSEKPSDIPLEIDGVQIKIDVIGNIVAQ